MSNMINVEVASRTDKGKGASRRLRRDDLMVESQYVRCCVIYNDTLLNRGYCTWISSALLPVQN